MTDQPAIQDIWVSTTEGAEITGYHPEYLQQLARKFWRTPETERLVRVRYRSRRYELWLPDLITYMTEHGYGPHKSSEE